MQEGRNSGRGIVGFTIPLEGNRNISAVAPSPIQVVRVPFPEIVRAVDRDRDVLFLPRIIRCPCPSICVEWKREGD